MTPRRASYDAKLRPGADQLMPWEYGLYNALTDVRSDAHGGGDQPTV